MKHNIQRKSFGKDLVNLVSEEAGCSIQYNGCPCNTCFHTWAEATLGLNSHLAHMFWLVVLALRGDYKEDEILKGNVENFKNIIREYTNENQKRIRK